MKPQINVKRVYHDSEAMQSTSSKQKKTRKRNVFLSRPSWHFVSSWLKIY